MTLRILPDTNLEAVRMVLQNGGSFVGDTGELIAESRVEAFCFRRRQVSKPSIPGIMMSSKIKTGFICLAVLIASSPLEATNSLQLESIAGRNVWKSVPKRLRTERL